MSVSPLDVRPLRWDSLVWLLAETLRTSLWYSRDMPGRNLIATMTGLGKLVHRRSAPVFLVGSPRSGTTFLGSCISCLPQTSYHHEPPLTKTFVRYAFENRWSLNRQRRYFGLVRSFLQALYGEFHLLYVEKMPRYALIMNQLALAFPESRFIHIVRDGRDVALSLCDKPWFRAEQARTRRFEPGGNRLGPFPRYWVEPTRRVEFSRTSDFHRCIWCWRVHVEAARRSAQQLGPQRCIELRYGSLARDPKESAAQLLDFLQLADDEGRLARAMGQARSRSVGRWQREATPEQLKSAEDEAGSLLKELGYV